MEQNLDANGVYRTGSLPTVPGTLILPRTGPALTGPNPARLAGFVPFLPRSHRLVCFIHTPGQLHAMANAVKKTISLPADLARDAEALAKAEGKTLSAVIQDALRQARIARRVTEFRGVQGYWSRKARDRGLLSEEDLERYLAE